jgi:hypothetical protein
MPNGGITPKERYLGLAETYERTAIKCAIIAAHHAESISTDYERTKWHIEREKTYSDTAQRCWGLARTYRAIAEKL